jgi:hypothetical protein
VGSRAGLNEVKKRKFLTQLGLDLRPLCRPARSQSLYQQRYPGSSLMITYLLIVHWLHSPLRTLASLKRDIHPSLSFAICLHVFTFSTHSSFSAFSSYLNFGLLTFLLASYLLYFLVVCLFQHFSECALKLNSLYILNSGSLRRF